MINYLKQNRLSIFLLSLWIIIESCSGGRYLLTNHNDAPAKPIHLETIKFEKELYSCQISGRIGIKKYSFSGLLFIKEMGEDGKRVVFQNEMGFNFFDFSWDTAGTFQVMSITDQMNHPALIKTLQKDFEVLLRHPKLLLQPANNNTVLFGTLSNGTVVYETKEKNSIQNIYILTPKNKKVVSMLSSNAYNINTLPESLTIEHHKANFDIKLKKLQIEQ